MAIWLAAFAGSATVVLPVFAQQACDTSLYPLSSPTQRFQDHGDGTTTDTVTQLVWMTCASGQRWEMGRCLGVAGLFNWSAAQAFAREVNRGAEYFYNDWRVPQLRELASIAERQCSNPRINLAVFPGTPAGFFWTVSSRPGVGTDGSAIALSFGADGISDRSKDENHHVRLVRTAR